MNLHSLLDYSALIDAFPYFAMVLDENHNVLAANTFFIREMETDPRECPLQCYPAIHATDGPPADCPLAEAKRTGVTAERVINVGPFGKLLVSVYPLMATAEDGSRLFLHLARPTEMANPNAEVA